MRSNKRNFYRCRTRGRGGSNLYRLEKENRLPNRFILLSAMKFLNIEITEGGYIRCLEVEVIANRVT